MEMLQVTKITNNDFCRKHKNVKKCCINCQLNTLLLCIKQTTTIYNLLKDTNKLISTFIPSYGEHFDVNFFKDEHNNICLAPSDYSYYVHFYGSLQCFLGFLFCLYNYGRSVDIDMICTRKALLEFKSSFNDTKPGISLKSVEERTIRCLSPDAFITGFNYCFLLLSRLTNNKIEYCLKVTQEYSCDVDLTYEVDNEIYANYPCYVYYFEC